MTIGAGTVLTINEIGRYWASLPGIHRAAYPAFFGAKQPGHRLFVDGRRVGRFGKREQHRTELPLFPFLTSSNEGSATVTTATLGACSDTETFTVTIDDAKTASALGQLPADIILNNDVDKCGANANWTPPTALDDCTPPNEVVVFQTEAWLRVRSVWTVRRTSSSTKPTTATAIR